MANNKKQSAAILALAFNKLPDTWDDTATFADVDAVLDALVVDAPVRFTDGRYEEAFGDAYARRDGIDPREDGDEAPLTAAQEALMLRKATRLYLLEIFKGTRAAAAAEAARQASLDADADEEE